LHGIIGVVASNPTSDGGHRLIGWNGGQGWLSNQRQLKTLKLEQALADVLVGEGSKAASLDLTEEVVKRLKATLARLEIIERCLLGGCRSVVDVAIGWVGSLMRMWWLVIGIGTLMMAAVISAVGIDRIVVCGWT
jgi:hypothetical protein